MSDMIKKIFSMLSIMPAFTNLFKKAAQTGRVDPTEALNALSSISPSTQKIANVAVDTVQRGGNISDAAQAVSNIGEVELLGQKMNTKTLVADLRKAGGICAMIANVLEKMPDQSPEEIAAFGNAASEVKNWQDVVI